MSKSNATIEQANRTSFPLCFYAKTQWSCYMSDGKAVELASAPFSTMAHRGVRKSFASNRSMTAFIFTFFLVSSLLILTPFLGSLKKAFGQSVEFIDQFGESGQDQASGVAVDSTGVYVVGTTNDVSESEASDAFVRKYTHGGAEEWTLQFGSSIEYDIASGVAVDSTGVYVVGTTNGLLDGSHAGLSDAFVRKYSLDGSTVEWTRQFGTLGHDRASGIAVDSTGVYVVGTIDETFEGENANAFVRKYSPDGLEEWIDQFRMSEADHAVSVAVDSTGVYVVGNARFGEIGGGDSQVFLRKYTHGGTEEWTLQFGTSSTDAASGVAVDSTGVYIVGSTGGDLEGTNFGSFSAFVRKYSLDGSTVEWTRQFNSEDTSNGSGVAVDSTGVYVVGTAIKFADGDSQADFQSFVRKYTVDGTEEWSSQIETSSSDTATGVAVDSTGVYVIGMIEISRDQNFTSKFDVIVAKLTVEDSPSTTLTVNTDQPEYRTSDTITVSGKLTTTAAIDQPILIQVSGPDGLLARLDQIDSAQDGSFSYSFVAGGLMLTDGTYTVLVVYKDLSAETTFEFDSGETPDDTLFCGRELSEFDNVIEGTSQSDSLVGTSADDLIKGFGGDDSIDGMGGNDCIAGHGGDDTLLGGPGNDGIYGGIGDDAIHGNDGIDTLYGNGGDDLISGGDGDDYIAGKIGNDSVFGNNGNDKLFGNEGDDLLKGGDGDDIMFGGEGHDVLLGNTGADRLSGQADEDALLGGRGDDRLRGGEGIDEIDGGRGHDLSFDSAENYDILPPIHCEEQIVL
jgi:Ca2+-binding RTX toxin-like protein